MSLTAQERFDRLLLRADRLLQLGRIVQARAVCDTAERRATEADLGPTSFAHVDLMRGEFAVVVADLESARILADWAQGRVSAEEQPEIHLKARLLLGRVWCMESRWAEAAEVLLGALAKVAPQCGDSAAETILRTQYLAGRSLANLERYEQSAGLLQRAYERAVECQFPDAEFLDSLASVWWDSALGVGDDLRVAEAGFAYLDTLVRAGMPDSAWLEIHRVLGRVASSGDAATCDRASIWFREAELQFEGWVESGHHEAARAVHSELLAYAETFAEFDGTVIDVKQLRQFEAKFEEACDELDVLELAGWLRTAYRPFFTATYPRHLAQMWIRILVRAELLGIATTTEYDGLLERAANWLGDAGDYDSSDPAQRFLISRDSSGQYNAVRFHYRHLAESCLRRRDYEGMNRAIDTAMERRLQSKRTPPGLYGDWPQFRVRQAWDQGDLERAETIARSVLEEADVPRFFRQQWSAILTECVLRAGRHDEAIGILADSREVPPRDAEERRRGYDDAYYRLLVQLERCKVAVKLGIAESVDALAQTYREASEALGPGSSVAIEARTEWAASVLALGYEVSRDTLVASATALRAQREARYPGHHDLERAREVMREIAWALHGQVATEELHEG